MRTVSLALAACAVVVTACTPNDAAEDEARATLGPADGRDLPGVALDRVQAGDVAPDFSLASLAGDIVTLSQFRGEKNVVLVFYRGHW